MSVGARARHRNGVFVFQPESVCILWFLQMGVKTGRGQTEKWRNKESFVCHVDGGNWRGKLQSGCM